MRQMQHSGPLGVGMLSEASRVMFSKGAEWKREARRHVLSASGGDSGS